MVMSGPVSGGAASLGAAPRHRGWPHQVTGCRTEEGRPPCDVQVGAGRVKTGTDFGKGKVKVVHLRAAACGESTGPAMQGVVLEFWQLWRFRKFAVYVHVNDPGLSGAEIDHH